MSARKVLGYEIQRKKKRGGARGTNTGTLRRLPLKLLLNNKYRQKQIYL